MGFKESPNVRSMDVKNALYFCAVKERKEEKMNELKGLHS